MTDREKLIEWVNDVLRYLPWGEISSRTPEEIADHLIANDVTVRERGRWIQDTPFACVCSVCNHERYGLANDSGDNFCPNCGADMRPMEEANV